MSRVGVTSYKWHLVGREGGGYPRGPIFPVGHCAAALLKDGVGLGRAWSGVGYLLEEHPKRVRVAM